MGVATSLVVAARAAVVVAERPSVQVDWLPGLPVGLAVDDLSAAMVLVVAAVLPLVLLSAAAEHVASPARFHGVMLIFGSAVLLTATATTLTALLVGWEVMGATSWALIAHSWRSAPARRGGLSAFVTTRAADLGLYAAVGAGLGGGVGTRLDALPSLDGGWLQLAAIGVAVAALAKSAQLPFSYWLSGAMHAPSQVSALLHSAAMVAMGGYLLLRLSSLLAAAGWVDTGVAWVGALTAVALGAVAVAQTDLKQLLAASTSAQLGFVALAAGVGGVADGRDELVAHAAVKACLFLAAGTLLHAFGTRRLRSLTGTGRLLPWVGVPAGVAALALAGVPPLSLWATKETLLSTVHETSLPLYLVALLASGLSAWYSGRLAWVLLLSPPAQPAWWDDERPGSRRVPAGDRIALVLLAGAAVGLTALAVPLRTSPSGLVWELLAVAAGLAAAACPTVAAAAGPGSVRPVAGARRVGPGRRRAPGAGAGPAGRHRGRPRPGAGRVRGRGHRPAQR